MHRESSTEVSQSCDASVQYMFCDPKDREVERYTKAADQVKLARAAMARAAVAEKKREAS